MPIPEPKKGEKKSTFVTRCAEFLKKEGKPKDQAYAICYTKWEKGNVSTRKLFERIDRIIGEEEDKYLTKKQKTLPDHLKKLIIASKKKKKNEDVSENIGLIGCNDCGGKIPKPSSFPSSCPDCGSSIKRPYSFRRSTPGRKKRRPQQ